MLCLLESQDLLGFIDGETQPPLPDSDHGESMGKLWRRTDRLVKGWILGSICYDALGAVAGLNSSREVWLELENLFRQKMKAAITNQVPNQTPGRSCQNGGGKDEDGILELRPEASNNALDQRNIVDSRPTYRIISMASSTTLAEYPWPSTVNVANFVTARPRLEQSNMQRSIKVYKLWKEQMLCLLESQDLLGFIDGETPPPLPDSDHGESMGKLWRRTDRLVKGWILGSICYDTLGAVAGLNSSREVWLELENLFRPKTKAPVTDQVPNQTSNNALDQGNIVDSRRKDMNSYLPLYKAALRGDWNEARTFLNENKEGITAVLNCNLETLLLAAVETSKSNEFLRNLIEIIPEDALVWKSVCGRTALHNAAVAGNTEAVIMLVNKNPKLQYILNDHNQLPVHVAAIGCRKDTLTYLISRSEMDVENSPFVGKLGGTLLAELIASEFVDLALYLVKKYPHMATSKHWNNNVAPLQVLADTSSLFLSVETLSWWQNWIYSCIALSPSISRKSTRDIEKSLSFDDQATKFSWSEVACRVPCVKSIVDKKVMHQQAVEFAKILCESVASLPYLEARPIYEYSILKAAHHGIHEVVEMIIEMFPSAVFVRDAHTGSSIFLLAASNRLENDFNLIYQMDDKKHFFFDSQDFSRNNFMHMCAKIAPPHKLNLVSGAALQMQRELQWFEEMKKFVNPSRRTWKNKDGLTPTMLFTKEHRELKEQGEKWMKETATSCSIAAALIATVVFSAAFTVPGGVDSEKGIPTLLHKTPFILFVITDSVSLFTSTTSLLVFLSILTSRYAEEDFLYVLPKRLCMGLIALFTSIIFMMFAFTIAIYITVQQKSKSIIIPVALLACFPVATFVFLQFPLLIDVLRSTYGPGIFGKKSGRRLY